MKTVNEYQRDFLEIILEEEALYPWNPSDPEAEEYFAKHQKDCFFADSLTSDELLTIDSSLYSQK